MPHPLECLQLFYFGVALREGNLQEIVRDSFGPGQAGCDAGSRGDVNRRGYGNHRHRVHPALYRCPVQSRFYSPEPVSPCRVRHPGLRGNAVVPRLPGCVLPQLVPVRSCNANSVVLDPGQVRQQPLVQPLHARVFRLPVQGLLVVSRQALGTIVQQRSIGGGSMHHPGTFPRAPAHRSYDGDPAAGGAAVRSGSDPSPVGRRRSWWRLSSHLLLNQEPGGAHRRYHAHGHARTLSDDSGRSRRDQGFEDEGPRDQLP